jgi:hypothetical protein
MKTPTCLACMSYGKIRCYGTKGLIRLLVCRNCGFAFADRSYWRNPYDNSDYYDLNPLEVSHAEFSKTDVDRQQLVVEGFPKGGRLLDFGGGVGSTAAAANHLGFLLQWLRGAGKLSSEGLNIIQTLSGCVIQKFPVSFRITATMLLQCSMFWSI